MPNLPVYESPTASRGLQPSDRGISAIEQEGREWNSAMHQLGNTAQMIGDVVEKHYAQKDAADLAKQGADAFANLTQNWNETAASSDPNNPDTAEKWRQDALEPALEKIGADVASKHGEEAAQRLRDSLRMHFTEKTVADQGTLAGLAVQSNLEQASNSLSNAVRSDPSSLNAAIGILDSAITSQVKSHGLDAVTATRIRTELFNKSANGIAESALFGLAETNPEAAQKALDAGTFDKYFSSSQMLAARKYVETQSKLVNTLEVKQNKEAADSEMATIQNTTIDPKNGELTIPKDYFSNVAQWAQRWARKPGAGETVAEKSRTAIQFGRSIMDELERGKPAVDDPHTVEDFRQRVTLGQGDPNALTEEEVIQARANGMLSDRSYSFYKGAVSSLAKDPALRSAQRDFNTFLKGIKSSITNSNILMGTNDPTGDKQFLAFSQDAQAQFDSAYQKGGMAEARKLLDRNNPNSLWQQSARYQTNQKGAMDSLQSRIQGGGNFIPAPASAAPARIKGESAAEYLKRTGGK